MSDAKWKPARNQLLDLSVTTEGERQIYECYQHFWHPVAYVHEVQQNPFSSDVNRAPLKVSLCGQDLVLAHLDGKIQAFNDLCPHKGTRLSLGRVVDNDDGSQALKCAYHGWEYDRSGHCTHIPQRPELVEHIRACVKTYQTREAYGMVWVLLAEEAHFPFPEFPEWGDPAWKMLPVPATNWNCASSRRVENYTDLLHFAFVHNGLLGDINEPGIPPHEVWRADNGVLRMYFEKEVTYREGASGTNRPIAKRHYHVSMPLTVHLRIDAAGNEYLLFFHPTPVGPKEIRNFTIAGSTFSSHDTVYEDLVTLAEVTYDQDVAIVESQRPEMLQEDLSFEMYLRDADTFTINYRRWLVEIARELAREDN